MTNEEAIKHITTWLYAAPDMPPKQVVQALELAVAALRAGGTDTNVSTMPAGQPLTLEQLRGMVEADRDGRCVFTKCKLGDTGGFFKKLLQSIDELKRELEIAVQDLETIMMQGGKNTDTCEYCRNDQCYVRGGRDCCNPIWRGRDNPSVTEKPCLIPYTGEP